MTKAQNNDQTHKKETVTDTDESSQLNEGGLDINFDEIDLDEDLSEFDINAMDADDDGIASTRQPDALTALKAERDEMRDRWMRALADAENNRKRGERDRRDAEIYGGAKLARDLLSVHDNLQRAIDAIDESQRETSKSVVEGIELTMRELISTFAKHKITPIVPEVGEKFDPKMHQAMFEAPVPDIHAGHIIQCLNGGFMIGERLLRPAQVGVSSTPANATSEVQAKDDIEKPDDTA